MRSVIPKNDTVVEYNPTSERIRQIMRKAGSKFGVVHFVKKSNGELRKMSYRVGVKKPKWATAPGQGTKKVSVPRKIQDAANDMMTVYDVNKVLRDSSGTVLRDDQGRQKRGAYRTVPLENVTLVVVNGIRYKVQRDS